MLSYLILSYPPIELKIVRGVMFGQPIVTRHGHLSDCRHRSYNEVICRASDTNGFNMTDTKIYVTKEFSLPGSISGSSLHIGAKINNISLS